MDRSDGPGTVLRRTSGIRRRGGGAGERDGERGRAGRLLDLLARHPYRQRLVSELMLAQYRAG